MTTTEEKARAGFAPCPTCGQYSHSIGDDALSEALRHFEMMYAHPLRGHPMGHVFDVQTREMAQRLITAALADDGWRAIETAPYFETVEIRAGSMTFLASLQPGISENDRGESVDQWVAERDGEHPPCWSEGACWESNTDEVMSLQPQAWRPSTEPAGDGKEGV